MPSKRATVVASVDSHDEMALADAWLAANKSALSYISEQKGCGCCVVEWDVTGPTDVVESLPAAISASSSWVRGDEA